MDKPTSKRWIGRQAVPLWFVEKVAGVLPPWPPPKLKSGNSDDTRPVSGHSVNGDIPLGK